jgi:hypothetical protein
MARDISLFGRECYLAGDLVCGPVLCNMLDVVIRRNALDAKEYPFETKLLLS